MEFTSFLCEINSIEYPTVPQDFYFSDFFSIMFSLTKELIQIDFSSSTITTLNEAFLVPFDVLRNGEDTAFLHEIFSSMPISPQILDQILLFMGRTARTILSREGCESSMPEIVVNLYVVVIQDSDFYNDDVRQDVPELVRLVNLLERSKIDEQDDDAEQCSICLEEFGHGIQDSSVKVVRTKCSHVFHESCMLRWLRHCADHQSPYFCPLCRCIIFPTSQRDE
ncbi:uncharacterized protein LOC107481505 [Arachis duranensis]|uniref:Uncharacterized protein LOC107481505 n=1 Tax=Arachis duranensis TaxID=130453 RepID=A0A6P4CTZ4_ARADU|nr:uncharacterized protein LOC107481505 [Arachis duranensis]